MAYSDYPDIEIGGKSFSCAIINKYARRIEKINQRIINRLLVQEKKL
ncbi:MAG: hypothetical protein PHE04_01910 [Bacteroidales bacterium]|jgi:hypothetical protein|nr:hypothetical protein [Bacteroidales bacterium]MDD4430545.1 hypothetical protein [Bacteroidales bacterium]